MLMKLFERVWEPCSAVLLSYYISTRTLDLSVPSKCMRVVTVLAIWWPLLKFLRKFPWPLFAFFGMTRGQQSVWAVRLLARGVMHAQCAMSYAANMCGFPEPRAGTVSWLSFRIPVPSCVGVELDTVAYVRDEALSTDVSVPTLLIRTPYGKLLMEPLAFAISTQGFNVVMQDCRGRFSSSGSQTFGALEDIDGAATLEWLAKNCDWCDSSKIVMWGISYLGLTQWAAIRGLVEGQLEHSGSDSESDGSASSLSEDNKSGLKLAAIAPICSGSCLFDVVFNSGVFNVDFYLRYTSLLTTMNSLTGVFSQAYKEYNLEKRMKSSMNDALGVRQLHEQLGVKQVFSFNPLPESGFWKKRDYSIATQHAPPAFIASGWHDMFLECSLKDFEAVAEAQGANSQSRLMVGPWHHMEPPVKAFHESFEFLKRHVGLTPSVDDAIFKPVSLWIMGARAKEGTWDHFESWPPPAVDWMMKLGSGSLDLCDLTSLAFCDQGSSASNGIKGVQSASSEFTYDPSDPTPMIGGTMFHACLAGEHEQQLLESRHDVVRFDTPPLTVDVVVVGRVRARLTVRTSKPYFDICARLLDVHPNGQSFNVCDGIFRKTKARADQRRSSLQAAPRSGRRSSRVATSHTQVVEVVFWGTAKRFMAGHKIRLLIAGSAYPRLARNFNDEGQAVDDQPFEVEPSQIEILHAADSVSELSLPVIEPVLHRKHGALAAAAARRPVSMGGKAMARRQTSFGETMTGRDGEWAALRKSPVLDDTSKCC